MRDRKEPTMGRPDMGEVSFSLDTERPRPLHRPATNGSSLGLIAKIAIGVFLGLSLFLLATCTMFFIGAKAAADEQARQQQAALAEFQRIANDPDPLGFQRELERRRRAEAAAKALQPGERCIQGRRFRRVENGWVQLRNPC